MPHNVRDDTPVIVTFLTSGHIDLSARGIDEAQAADLRERVILSAPNRLKIGDELEPD